MNIKNLDTFGKRLKFILELKEIRNKDLAKKKMEKVILQSQK